MRKTGVEPRKSTAPHPDLAIAELAERQHGVMNRRQLLAAGVSDDAIRHRLAVNRLCTRHRGVYEITGQRPNQGATFMAAVLAGGNDAVLSHRSAAALWNLRCQTTGPVEVTLRPVVNGIVRGWEVDFYWPEVRLIVETGGGQAHATRAAFHRDRRRDLDLELAGWHVIRISWRQLCHEPDRVLALLRAHLGA